MNYKACSHRVASMLLSWWHIVLCCHVTLMVITSCCPHCVACGVLVVSCWCIVSCCRVALIMSCFPHRVQLPSSRCVALIPSCCPHLVALPSLRHVFHACCGAFVMCGVVGVVSWLGHCLFIVWWCPCGSRIATSSIVVVVAWS
jgi:hypothetical protein